jgi:hypothetical protein
MQEDEVVTRERASLAAYILFWRLYELGDAGDMSDFVPMVEAVQECLEIGHLPPPVSLPLYFQWVIERDNERNQGQGSIYDYYEIEGQILRFFHQRHRDRYLNSSVELLIMGLGGDTAWQDTIYTLYARDPESMAHYNYSHHRQRGTIVVSPRATRLDRDQLEMVMAHEMVHASDVGLHARGQTLDAHGLLCEAATDLIACLVTDPGQVDAPIGYRRYRLALMALKETLGISAERYQRALWRAVHDSDNIAAFASQLRVDKSLIHTVLHHINTARVDAWNEHWPKVLDSPRVVSE